MANRWGNNGNSDRLYFGEAPKSLQMVTTAMKLKDAWSLEENLWPTYQHIKKQRHNFANKGPSIQSYDFSSSYVWMWELSYKESCAPKNWCFWTVVLKTWESFGLQEDQTSKSSRRPVLTIQWKDWCWSWNFSTLATWFEELTHWKRPWCWEKLRAGGEGDDRGWDGWMASLTGWTWVWTCSVYWWWTRKPEVHGVVKSQTRLSSWTDWLTDIHVSMPTRVIHKPLSLCLLEL